jgi:tetratricopeptide (TPR) repeat protein
MPIITIVGGVATGKTALAVEWAHNNRHRFTDGQLFATLTGFDERPPARPFDVLADFLVAMGISPDRLPDTTERRTSLFRSMVDGRKMLILLDNARNTGQVRPLLPGSGSCMVLVTSRHRLPDLVSRHAARRISLGSLSRRSAVSLLRYGMNAEESTALSTAVDLCGRLPGLLRAMADLVAERPHVRLEDLVTGLQGSADHVLEFGGGEEDTPTVAAQLSWTFVALTPATARTFLLVALHFATEFGVGDAAALADTDAEQAQRHLHALWSVHLVEQTGHQRYHFCAPELAFARRQVRLDHSTEDQQAAERRLLEWYLDNSRSAVHVLQPPSEPAVSDKSATEAFVVADAHDALEWLRTEYPNLVAAVRRAIDLETPEAHLLPLALGPYFALAGCLDDWRDTHATALRSACRAGDEHSKMSAHLGLADAYRALGRLDDVRTHLTRALELSRDLGLRTEQATALRGLGSLAHVQGDSEAGLRWCEEAHRSAIAVNDRAGEAASLHHLGVIRSERQEHDRAIVLFQQALAIREDLGILIGLATTCCELGLVHLHLGGLDEAFDHCGRTVDIGDRHAARRTDMIRALIVLGEVEYQRGNHFTCLSQLHRALALCHPRNDRAHAAHALDVLGNAFCALGKRKDANEEWQQALLLLTELDDPHAEHIRARLAELTSTPGEAVSESPSEG